jgi:hypothetical protein
MVDLAKLVDPARADKAAVVLRVRRLGPPVADKYAWVRVTVLAVIKNASDREFAGELEIAYYAGDAGLPDAECTVYLEPYSDAPEHPWKLLGGNSQQGVSHVAPSAR